MGTENAIYVREESFNDKETWIEGQGISGLYSAKNNSNLAVHSELYGQGYCYVGVLFQNVTPVNSFDMELSYNNGNDSYDTALPVHQLSSNGIFESTLALASSGQPSTVFVYVCDPTGLLMQLSYPTLGQQFSNFTSK